jgi:DNA-binding transcriptional ArsR family regulator
MRWGAAGLATALSLVALVAFLVTSGPPTHLIGRALHEQRRATAQESAGAAWHHGRPGSAASPRVHHNRSPKRRSSPGRARAPSAARELGAGAEGIWHVLRTALLAVAALAVAYAAYRLLYLRPRQIARWARFALVQNDADIGRSGSVADTWAELVEALQRRWWERLLGGVGSITAELHHRRDPASGAMRVEGTLVLADEGHLIEHVEAALRSTYENLRLERLDGRLAVPASTAYPVRLKRARSFLAAALAAPAAREERSEFAVDRIKAAMEALRVASTVAFTITPTPAWYETLVRWELAAREKRAAEGEGGSAAREEAKVAEALANRPLAFCEIRVCADERAVAKQLARAVRGSARSGEGRLAIRYVRLRAGLYRRRIERGAPNPIPSWSRGVYSTAELAGLWRLTNQFRNAARVDTHPMPRLPAPASVRRVAAGDGMVLVEAGEDGARPRGLWLWPEDLHANVGMLGTIGAGKTTAMIRAARTLALPWPENRNRFVILATPKPDDALRYLDALDTEKPVYVLDFARPEIGFSPLRSSLPVAKRSEAVIEGMLEMYRKEDGDSQLYAASIALIKTFVDAMLALLQNANFHDLADFLSATKRGGAARRWLLSELPRHPELGYLYGEVEEIVTQLREAKGKFVERMAAPRNKLTRLRTEPMGPVLHHPLQLDLRTLMEERAVLVVSGQAGTIGAEAMRGLMTMLLVMVVSTVLTQQDRPASGRVDVTLALDEAHYFMNNNFLKTGLATARSAGLSSIFAFQHLGQLARGDDLRMLTSLIGSWVFFRLAAEDAEDVAPLLQPIHHAGFSPTDQMLERRWVDPHALLSARRFWAVGRLVARGEPSATLTAVVEREPGASGGGARYLDRMRRAGARFATVDDLEIPPRPWLNGADSRHEHRGGSATSRHERDSARATSKAGAGEQLALREREDAPERAVEHSPARSGRESASGTAESTKSKPRHGESPRWRIARRAAVEMPAELPAPPPALQMLDRYREMSGIRYEAPLPAESPRPRRDGSRRWAIVPGAPQPSRLGLEVMSWLWEFGFMAAFQIEQRLGKSKRATERLLHELRELGLVERFYLTLRARGKPPALYRLTRPGFELLKLSVTREGSYLEPAEQWEDDATVIARQIGAAGQAEWQAQRKRKAVTIPHDLQAISWALQFERLLAPCLRRTWKRKAWQLPPADKVRVGGEERWVVRSASELSTPEGFLANLDFEFGAVRPDVAFEVDVDAGERAWHLDVFVEFEHQGVRHGKIREKVRSADAMATGWGRFKSRFEELDGPPDFLFVFPTIQDARRAAEIADQVCLGAIGRPSLPEHRFRYGGRGSMFFTAAPLAYHRTPLAFSLPPLPPYLRERLAPNGAARKAAGAASAGFVVEYPLARVLEMPRGVTPSEAARS